jgi:hypothetical protein
MPRKDKSAPERLFPWRLRSRSAASEGSNGESVPTRPAFFRSRLSTRPSCPSSDPSGRATAPPPPARCSSSPTSPRLSYTPSESAKWMKYPLSLSSKPRSPILASNAVFAEKQEEHPAVEELVGAGGRGSGVGVERPELELWGGGRATPRLGASMAVWGWEESASLCLLRLLQLPARSKVEDWNGREVRRGNGGGGSARLWQCCSRGSKSLTALWTKIWKREKEEKEAYHLEVVCYGTQRRHSASSASSPCQCSSSKQASASASLYILSK